MRTYVILLAPSSYLPLSRPTLRALAPHAMVSTPLRELDDSDPMVRVGLRAGAWVAEPVVENGTMGCVCSRTTSWSTPWAKALGMEVLHLNSAWWATRLPCLISSSPAYLPYLSFLAPLFFYLDPNKNRSPKHLSAGQIWPRPSMILRFPTTKAHPPPQLPLQAIL